MSKPQFITFTGVDDETDPVELVKLADDYPVEFGLLFSPKRQGIEPRYPRIDTISWLVEELPLRWSAHLCGGDARSVIAEDNSQHGALLNLFQRVQINTADPKADPIRIAGWAARHNLRAILQCRDGFPRVSSVDILFDASGGRGISPKGWPIATRTTFCGYAGGLNPENVAAAVADIGAQEHLRYWIDMESGVRDEHDRFDLNKCRAVCEAVYATSTAKSREAAG